MKHLRKTIPFHMLILAGLLPVVSATSAAEKPGNPDDAPESAPPPNPQSTEVAFLGIETVQVDAATRTRLKLAEGTGLRVQFIAPQSPASSKLQVGDVLVRLDDQILCNHNQLRALVRSKKPKDTVTLNAYRDGQSMDVKVTLGQVTVPDRKEAEINISREMPFAPDLHFRFNGQDRSLRDMMRERMADASGGIITLDPDMFKDIPDEAREMLREMKEMNRRRVENFRQKFQSSPEIAPNANDMAMGDKTPLSGTSTMRIEITDEDGNPANARGPAKDKPSDAPVKSPGSRSVNKRLELHDGLVSATTVIHDNEGSVSLTMRDGSREVVIKDTAGKTIFEGPVNTEENRKAMPEAARKRLETLETLSGGITNSAS